MTARQKLSSLLTYLDGKSGAETLVNRILENEELLKTLADEAHAADAADAGKEA